MKVITEHSIAIPDVPYATRIVHRFGDFTTFSQAFLVLASTFFQREKKYSYPLKQKRAHNKTIRDSVREKS